MAHIPISIEKIKVEELAYPHGKTETVKYLFKLIEKGQDWQKTFICNRDALIKLRDEINVLLEVTTTAETLCVSGEKAAIIDKSYKNDTLCKECNYKLTNNCKVCLFELQSPLERKLFLELLKGYISFKCQYAINWKGQNVEIDGSSGSHRFANVLTIADFFIEKGNTKLCIYTDGHTYHERTEDQALRDRNIDRKLQELGFTVLRYTGKEVNENTGKIVNEIKKWIEKV